MRTSFSLCLAVLLVSSSALLQETRAQQAEVSPADAKINQLESNLSKLRDTSPEAAAVMLELVDAYHAEGRVFGLIRVGQTFVTAFTQHPQHRAIMLKLLDGL